MKIEKAEILKVKKLIHEFPEEALDTNVILCDLNPVDDKVGKLILPNAKTQLPFGVIISINSDEKVNPKGLKAGDIVRFGEGSARNVKFLHQELVCIHVCDLYTRYKETIYKISSGEQTKGLKALSQEVKKIQRPVKKAVKKKK